MLCVPFNHSGRVFTQTLRVLIVVVDTFLEVGCAIHEFNVYSIECGMIDDH